MALRTAANVFSDLMEAREPLDRLSAKNHGAATLLTEIKGTALSVGVAGEALHEHTLILTFPLEPNGIYINYDKRDATWSVWAVATKRTIVNLRWSRSGGRWTGVGRWTSDDGNDHYELASSVLAKEVEALLGAK